LLTRTAACCASADGAGSISKLEFSSTTAKRPMLAVGVVYPDGDNVSGACSMLYHLDSGMVYICFILFYCLFQIMIPLSFKRSNVVFNS